MIASTPTPPYFAVIFTSVRSEETGADYEEMAQRMEELARVQPGFLGMESIRKTDCSITVSYWNSLEAIVAWKEHAEHRVAQALGKSKWYDDYRIRISRVERDYGMTPDSLQLEEQHG